MELYEFLSQAKQEDERYLHIHLIRKKVWDDMMYNIMKMALDREPYVKDKDLFTFYWNPEVEKGKRQLTVLFEGKSIGQLWFEYKPDGIAGHFIPSHQLNQYNDQEKGGESTSQESNQLLNPAKENRAG